MTLSLENPLTGQAIERAKTELFNCLDHYNDAMNKHEDAKAQLEFKKAKRICEGIEGKNSEERDAKLKLALEADYRSLQTCEGHLRHARNSLEQSRLSWDCLRYKLRLLEATTSRGAA